MMKKKKVPKKLNKKKPKKLTHIIFDSNNGEHEYIYDNKVEESLKNYYFNYYEKDEIEYINKEVKLYKLDQVKFKLEASIVKVTIG